VSELSEWAALSESAPSSLRPGWSQRDWPPRVVQGRFTLRGMALVVGCLAVVAVHPGELVAQVAADRLWGGCAAGAAGSQELSGRCADAALTAQALQSGLGLLMTAGGPVPASPSTAGRRRAAQPRIVVDGGLAWVSFRHPDLQGAPSQGRIRDRRAFTVGPRLTGAVGLFEGFSPVPGVGGILAVDAVGMLQYLRLPESAGFSGGTAGWGGGLRVGVFRESFTLPGFTISGMHYRMGRVLYGDLESAGAQTSLRPRATSLRAIVGKDLLTVGVSGGLGWDRYGGSSRIEARVPQGGIPGGAVLSGSGGPEDLRLSRRYLFVGANFTWVVAQVAGEVVWAGGTSPLPTAEGTSPYRPGGRELQGTLSARITF